MRTWGRYLGVLIILAVFSLRVDSQQKPAAERWSSMNFLLGNWVGEGTGTPGQGTGEFSFHADVQEKVLVRRNRADYPATKDRPAYSHTDLMVIYREAEGKPLRAIYFDNEDHVIHYTLAVSADGNSTEFLSDVETSSPHFRLTYRKTGDNKLAIKFEIAPPDKPEAFSTYIEATARKKT